MMIKSIFVREIESVDLLELTESKYFKVNDDKRFSFLKFKEIIIGKKVRCSDAFGVIDYSLKEFFEIYGDRYKLLNNKIFKKPFVKINMKDRAITKYFDTDEDAKMFYQEISEKILFNRIIEIEL